LWSTIETDTISQKVVPLKYVNNEILKFYSHYKQHYDLTGFSKERFIEEVDYGFKDWEFINEIEELTVIAVKSNTGSGSVVLVMFISKINVNLIVFTNNTIERDYNYIFNSKYEKDKFWDWLETLKN
jgi:hypothetical protein